MNVQTWLIDKSAQERAELLAMSKLGRLGVIVDGRPEIFPVNHVYDRETGSVAFPTNDRTKLHGSLAWIVPSKVTGRRISAVVGQKGRDEDIG